MAKAKKTKRETVRKPETAQKVVTIVKARGEPDEVTVERGDIVFKPKSKEMVEPKPKPERVVTESQPKIEESTPKRVRSVAPRLSGSKLRITAKTPRLS